MLTGGMMGEFSRYLGVGAIGFVVDAGVLWLLLHQGVAGPYLGRAISFFLAASLTWILHRSFTYPAARPEAKGRQWLCFVAVNALGATLNYAIYVAVVVATVIGAEQPVLAVVVGSAVALAFNFVANRKWVFREAQS